MNTPPVSLDSLAIDKTTLAWLKALKAMNLPPVSQVPVDQLRAGLEANQAKIKDKPKALSDDLDIPAGPSGKVSVRLLRPSGVPGKRPIVVYLHGGGWVNGSPDTHDRFARDIVNASGAAMAVVHYSRSPEVRYPVALEECYAVTAWLAENGGALGLDDSRIALLGDSSGGNLAAAVALLAHRRGGPAIRHQTLIYPVVDASCSTPSYEQYAEGLNLTRDAMRWYWEQYVQDEAARADATASVLLAPVEDLAGMPPTLLVTAEFDVLRDEGEAFAARLMKAGVAVTATRYLGTVHAFASNNALAGTPATRALVAQVGNAVREAFKI